MVARRVRKAHQRCDDAEKEKEDERKPNERAEGRKQNTKDSGPAVCERVLKRTDESV